MNDNNSIGRLLPVLIAVPVLAVCCGGGLALFAGTIGAISGWLSGLGTIWAVAIGIAMFLIVRAVRQARKYQLNKASELHDGQ